MSLSHNGYVFKSSMAFRTCDSENLRTTTRYDSDMASKRVCHAVVVAVALPAEPVPLPPRYALRWTGWRPSVACSFAIAIAD